MAALKQYPGLEPDGDEVHRSDKLMKESTNVFKFDGSADNAIVQEVKSWFTNLIKGRHGRRYNSRDALTPRPTQSADILYILCTNVLAIARKMCHWRL